MLFDTHAHVNFAAFKEDAEATIQRALDKDVRIVLVGTQIDTSAEAVKMAEKFKGGVYAAVGIHPVHTYSQELDEEETHFKSREEKFDYAQYRELASRLKVVGIGECGLDYYRLPENLDQAPIKKLQRDAFIEQIKLAKELNKTLIIHSRSSKGTDDACLDILEILKNQGVEGLRMLLHSYTGSPEVARKFVELGAFVSFNGIITFDKTGNQEAVLKVVPDDKIVLETDCPYLTPVPMRGKKNEPAYVEYVAQKVALLKGMDTAELEALTTSNAERLFRV